VAYLSAAGHTAAVATAPDGGIGLVDAAVGEKDDRGEPEWSYDADRKELVVGGEYDGPLPWKVCVARALANPRTWRQILSAECLEEDPDAQELATLLEEHREVLRGMRCLGYLSDDIDGIEDYRDAILEAERDLCELTKDLAAGEYEDRNDHRGEILRLANGLAGTMVHLLDLVDVDVNLQAKVPRFRSFDAGDRRDLCQHMALTAAIHSRYGQITGYRALFEDRDERRQDAIMPGVDAADPIGEHICSVTIAGPGVSALEDELRRALRHPEDLVADAPEFAVPVPARAYHGNDTYGTVISRICRRKGLDVTREAVATVQGLAASPYAAADAVEHLSQTTSRELRPDEVRFALAQLHPDRLAVDAPSAAAIVATLLAAEEPLTQRELADRAGVSPRSVRNHEEVLVAIGLLDRTGAGYRLQLSFGTTSERRAHNWRYPASVTDDGLFYQDLLWELVATAESDPPDTAIDSFGGPELVDVKQLCRACPWLRPWVDIAYGICGTGDPAPATPCFGAMIEQQPIQSPTSTTA
jgi:hypothetical protein